jgi:glutamate-1-semialdehyde 2,1-aminomutase
MTTTQERTTGVIDRYNEKTAHSREHFARARSLIPAGATRSLNAWAPYPLYLQRGEGATVWDVDGNPYLDFLNNYTALLLGHSHPHVIGAITEQLRRGTAFSFSTELEAALAELLVKRIPSVERLRFTGSGTEAGMFAVRLARTFTERPKIAKMEGGYHGTYDGISVSVRPALDQAGPITSPLALPESAGLIPGVTQDVVILPFNHPEETAALVETYAGQLAAIFVEPVLGVGGVIPPAPGYLALLRDLCTKHRILLIFDEVITLRLASGGGQQLFGVTPDLTTMGKIIGGGLPVGAVGGRADVMRLLEPQGGHDVYDARTGGPKLYQGGTFTGHPLTLAAGIATIEELPPEVYERLNALGEALRHRLLQLFERRGAPATVTGIGSLFNIHMTAEPVRTFRETRQANSALQQALFLSLLNEGVIIAPRGMACLSTAMGEAEIDAFALAVDHALSALEVTPEWQEALRNPAAVDAAKRL